MDYGRKNNGYYRFCFSGHHFGSTMLNVNDTKEKPIKKSSAKLVECLTFLVRKKYFIFSNDLSHFLSICCYCD